MSLWQDLADSYDKNADILSSIYPISTTTISNNGDIIATIIIDGEGNFLKADKFEKVKKDKNGKDSTQPVQICIPVTEKSMGRSSGIAPHPVFDQYEYLNGNGKKFEAYISELAKFASSEFATQQIKAIYKYVAKGTVKTDLEEIAPKDKTNIIFEVQIPGNLKGKVWEDKMFFEAWNNYYLNQIKNTKTLDYITGNYLPIASSHPKKIANSSANAKLISDNDSTNFTFRGKFKDSTEAFSISYEASQKAHQFLRYLINEKRGYYCGEQVILSFTIGSIRNSLPPPLDDTKSIWDFLQEFQCKTEHEKQINLRAETGLDYADALKKSLGGFGYSKTMEQHIKTAVIVLDAATTGRLSITFYRELDRNEYLECVADWHQTCKWNLQFWSNENQKFVKYISAPTIDKIIESVYGKSRSNNDESYIKIKKTARERLLRCIFDKALLPVDYVTAAVRRASNPLGITTNGKFDRDGFNQLLATTCALVCKNYQQNKKEELKLNIELERSDRDYLYGRLLGAADKLEERALKEKDKGRITAAIRHMQAFSQHPFRTWQTIHNCLTPYIQMFRGDFALNEIQTIHKLFKPSDYKNDDPLNGLYLIGYYHERAYIEHLIAEAKNKKQTIINEEKEIENVRQ